MRITPDLFIAAFLFLFIGLPTIALYGAMVLYETRIDLLGLLIRVLTWPHWYFVDRKRQYKACVSAGIHAHFADLLEPGEFTTIRETVEQRRRRSAGASYAQERLAATQGQE